MGILLGLLFASGAYPLGKAWLASARQPLRLPLTWALIAWLAWGGLAALVIAESDPALEVPRYLALLLTGCAGVAVLGSRRPGVAAWNFVVLGLAAVLLWPLLEQLVVGGQPLHWLRLLFIVGTLAYTVLNYLPTCLALAALLLAIGCGQETWLLAQASAAPLPEAPGLFCLAVVPWAAYLGWRGQPAPASEFDRLWRGFRNRYGVVWGQRVREQFNRAAAHAGWPVQLYWQGLRIHTGQAVPAAETQTEMLRTLRALLKRFLPPEAQTPATSA
jgi:hypothetical protein